jgi:glycosyltransferase involved in cell wall biosynthesis
MKILFILEHFHPYLGGAEHLFWTLSKALVNRGNEVGVVTTRFRKDLPKQEEIEGIKIYRVNCYNRYFFSLFSLPVAVRLLPNYDIVHTTSYNAALPAWIAARIRKKPVIITFHEVWGKLWWQLPYASLVERLAFYYWEKLLLKLPFDRFIGVSEFTRRALIDSGISDQKALRIYNGMEYDDFKGYHHQAPDTFTFTYFGRLGISKGLNLLIPAAAEHFKKYPTHRLRLIIPKYPEVMFNRMITLINQLGMQEQVELLHHLPRNTLFEYICQSSCIVVPSYSEGFCFVATETIALGVPIISSQKGALAEVVGGKYLAMGNQSKEAIVDTLEKAYQEQWEEKPIPVYELSDAVNTYIDLYDKLMK